MCRGSAILPAPAATCSTSGSTSPQTTPAAADRVYDRLDARVRTLERFPELGTARPEIAPEARVLVEPPYRTSYRLHAKAVQIVRVVHGARRIDSALFGEGVE